MGPTDTVTYYGIAKALRAAVRGGYMSEDVVNEFGRALMDAVMSMRRDIENDRVIGPSSSGAIELIGGALKLFIDKTVRLECLTMAIDEKFDNV